MKVTDLQDRKSPVRLLLYGTPGCGKTTFASGAPNPIWLDYENSTEVLRKNGINVGMLGESAKDLKDFDKVVEWIRKDAPKSGYETIVIDTISSMNLAVLMQHLEEVTQGGKKRDKHIALFHDFRKNTNQMRELYLALIECPLHVVVIGHTAELRDPDTNKLLEVRPSLPPAARDAISQLVNECFFMTRTVKAASLGGKVERKIVVDAEGLHFAKNRQGFTQSEFQNPTWKEIYPNA
jgi:GTPase SAR1 family protein